MATAVGLNIDNENIADRKKVIVSNERGTIIYNIKDVDGDMFKCKKCGTVWNAIIQNRIKGKGNCPNCREVNAWQLSFPEVYIYNELKQMDP